MGIATCLLEAGQSTVAEHCHKRLHCQCLLDQHHALRQVPFSRLQVVPLAQQITQAKIVGEAGVHGMQHFWSWDYLHHLGIGGSAWWSLPCRTCSHASRVMLFTAGKR